MNVIQGSRDQLIVLLATLASSESTMATKQAWLVEDEDRIRQFRQKYRSREKVLEIAAQLGIQGRSKMADDELIVEIIRLSPELADKL